MLLAIYVVIVIVLPLALGTYVLFNGLPRTRRCPSCAAETLRLQSRPHRLASRVLRHQALHRRWCPACGWLGTSRIPHLYAVAPAVQAPREPTRPEGTGPGPGPGPGTEPGGAPRPAREASADASADAAADVDARRTADSVDIRVLHVDSGAVRVRVQCWAAGGEWRGRLLFVGSGGKTWAEDRCSIRGKSALEVLSQALTMPDRALAGRLRQVRS